MFPPAPMIASGEGIEVWGGAAVQRNRADGDGRREGTKERRLDTVNAMVVRNMVVMRLDGL